MNSNLDDFKVADRKDFSQLVLLLHDDYLKNPEHWENKSLSDFLKALSAYADDIQGYYDNTKSGIDANEPRWQTFADILMGAKFYE